MWPFRSRAPEIDPDVIRALNKRMDELGDNQHKLDKKLSELELDWREWFDKFRLLYARLSKRIREAASAAEDGAQSLQDAPESTNPRAVAYDRPFVTRGGPKTPRSNYGG